jgi:ketosteroid isomerase-like protein
MSQDNIEIVKRGYDAFIRGDIPAVLEMLGERLEGFGVVSDAARPAPWHGTARKTRDDAAGFFQALAGTLEPLKFEYQHLVASGEYVYATTQHEYRVRKTGKILVMRDVFHRWHIVRGRVVEILCAEDTAQTRDALEG